MNRLEEYILKGALAARKSYDRLTDGEWLDHAPESFLQIETAKSIGRLGYAVFIDASHKKNKIYLPPKLGRPHKNASQRPDISVWYKGKSGKHWRLRAAIEVKRAYSIVPLERDADKLKKYLAQMNAPKNAYLLVYSATESRHKHLVLEKRFSNWANKLSWDLIPPKTGTEEGGTWGFALMRYVPS